MSDRNLPLLIGAAGALAALFFFSKKAAAATAAAPAGSPGAASLPGPVFQAMTLPELAPGLAPTSQAIAASGSFWDSLEPTSALSSGYINFPSGTQVGAATFRFGLTRTDALGNYYVQWAGETYELGSQDAAGNWPATLVSQS